MFKTGCDKSSTIVPESYHYIYALFVYNWYTQQFEPHICIHTFLTSAHLVSSS